MELVNEMTMRLGIEPERVVVGRGPYGARVAASLSGGTVEGARINGTVAGAGADWALVRSDGFVRIDVRLQIVTDDGAGIYLQYLGLLEMNEAVNAAMTGGGETAFDDQYIRTTPIFETGDERYAWLNQSVFVARGRMTPGGVEYEVFRVA